MAYDYKLLADPTFHNLCDSWVVSGSDTQTVVRLACL